MSSSRSIGHVPDWCTTESNVMSIDTAGYLTLLEHDHVIFTQELGALFLLEVLGFHTALAFLGIFSMLESFKKWIVFYILLFFPKECQEAMPIIN